MNVSKEKKVLVKRILVIGMLMFMCIGMIAQMIGFKL